MVVGQNCVYRLFGKSVMQVGVVSKDYTTRRIASVKIANYSLLTFLPNKLPVELFHVDLNHRFCF